MFFWKTYTATVTKAAIKPVHCEKCGCHFEYEVIRKAKGYGESIYCLDNRGAEERSLRRATRTCDKLLAKAIKLTACPKCGWFQKNMVQAGKKKRLLYTLLAAFPVSWCITILLLVTLTTPPSNGLVGSLPYIGFFVTVAAAVYWFFRYDPNRPKSSPQKAKVVG